MLVIKTKLPKDLFPGYINSGNYAAIVEFKDQAAFQAMHKGDNRHESDATVKRRT